jgi:hypothetical protein
MHSVSWVLKVRKYRPYIVSPQNVDHQTGRRSIRALLHLLTPADGMMAIIFSILVPALHASPEKNQVIGHHLEVVLALYLLEEHFYCLIVYRGHHSTFLANQVMVPFSVYAFIHRRTHTHV